ncbi:hypothetical protein EYZ11_004459 [Aspergillus tanneri]|nr:hypothetical protein EYZ11_004459 [Aspergillus tanneri]
MSLLLPTAFHASWSDNSSADKYTLKVSRGTSVVLLLVYILYIVFQLKSHSYLYASIPQQIIDEESHPGVLAEFMNPSSDSSSSSSDNESVDTTTSWSTAKRIKRAMKSRRYRKSSTSSKDSGSLRKKSVSEAPSAGVSDTVGSIVESIPSHPEDQWYHATSPPDDSRYDADNDTHRFNVPQSRDFGRDVGRKKVSRRDSKAKKRRSKANKKPKMTQEQEKEAAIVATTPVSTRPKLNALSAPPDCCESHVVFQDASEIPKRRSPFRPIMPSLLSNTVFSTTVTTNNTAPVGSSGNFNGLRRSNSLPSKMNQMNRPPPVGNAVQFARGAARMPTAVHPTTAEVPPPSHEPDMSRTAAVVMLLLSTGLVAVCAEFLVDAIPSMIKSSNVSEAFIGLIILPIVGNAAEHVTAVTVATKNKMDLAIGVSVGSSIQIVVILGWCMDKEMTLYFTLFETVCLFVTAFVVNFLVLDGRSNYLEGALLIAAYVIIGVGAFFYPATDKSSDVGSVGSFGNGY